MIFSQKKFNENNYLDANPDVKLAVNSGSFSNGLDHYKRHGKAEGRPLRKQRNRLDKIFYGLNKKGHGLEIGPSFNPVAPKKEGYLVETLDHASADDLRKKYFGHNNVNIENIEEVDYVWTGQEIDKLIGKQNFYDWIIASHVIEHVPDFISFLQQCSILLRDDGKISLVIPDKRYCFDYFQPITSTGRILDSFFNKSKRPTVGQIFDEYSSGAKRNGMIAWGPEYIGGPDALIRNYSDVIESFPEISEMDEYIDVHCWKFTPSSFKLIMKDLLNLGYVNLQVDTMFETTGCEFFAVLSKSCTDNINPRVNSDRVADLNAVFTEQLLNFNRSHYKVHEILSKRLRSIFMTYGRRIYNYFKNLCR